MVRSAPADPDYYVLVRAVARWLLRRAGGSHVMAASRATLDADRAMERATIAAAHGDTSADAEQHGHAAFMRDVRIVAEFGSAPPASRAALDADRAIEHAAERDRRDACDYAFMRLVRTFLPRMLWEPTPAERDRHGPASGAAEQRLDSWLALRRTVGDHDIDAMLDAMVDFLEETT